jgi:choloylglycine hydrolase
MTRGNTLSWKAQYGSVVSAIAATEQTYVACDGFNEQGLAGHLLWLAEADYGQRDKTRPGLNIALWLQYYLDNFTTVQEAVDFTRKIPYQIETITFDGEIATAHLALDDQTGDSAIIEFIGDKPKIYHGREYTVMTNSPPFDKQLANLQEYQGFGGDKPLPGTTDAADRFVRAAYYRANLPRPHTYREAIGGILSVIRNISQPFGVAEPGQPNTAPTQWRTVTDLSNLVYFFESSMSPNIVWVELRDLDLAEGTPAKKLDLTSNLDRVGDTSKQFEEEKPFAIPTLPIM